MTILFITTELLGQAEDWIQLELGFRPSLTRARNKGEWGIEICEEGLTQSQIDDVVQKLLEFLSLIYKDTVDADVSSVP